MSDSLTNDEKLRMLSDLIRLASADGQHHDEEYDFLHRVAEELGVEPMDMEKLFTSSIEHPAPREERERIRLFHFLLDMAAVDGHIHMDEIILIKDLGMRLGLNMQAIEQSIKLAQTYTDAKVPYAVMTEVFALHQN